MCTTEAFDWKLYVSYREAEFIETSLIAYPWNDLRFNTCMHLAIY